MWKKNPKGTQGVICSLCNIIIEHEVPLHKMHLFPHPHHCKHCEAKQFERSDNDAR